MKNNLRAVCLAGICILAGMNMVFAADIPAFPGAQGWGKWAKGARASASPTVYRVTNLNDSGTGSLRDAVSKPNRIVVFDVSGVIQISSRIVFSSNLYVAGQTAPGEGITIYGNGVSFSGASNIICRYLRIRMGHRGDSGKDCAGISRGTNMIFDHCSFSWGLDETFSINPDGKGDLYGITLMNCIFGQGLMTHSAGGLMQADSITLYRNLYCDNATRNNKVKGINQYANNIVYNWSNAAYIMGGDSEGSSYVNIESNLFINGPSKGGAAFTGANAKFHCYGVDNWQDQNINGIFDPVEITDYSASDHRSVEPYDYPELDLYPGNQLIELNLPTVGASLPYRDQSDCYMVDEVLSFGKKGALISNEETLPIGSPATWDWWAGTQRLDTDQDGMPDAWEDAHGTDKNKADAMVKAANGYLNIENYLNSITVEDRQYFLRRPITLTASSTTSTLVLQWRDYTYDEAGFAIEYRLVGEENYYEAGRTVANATTYTLTGLSAGDSYEVRVRAFGQHDGAETYSEYATGTFKTRPQEVGIVDIDNFRPTVTNSTAVAEGDSLLLTTDDALDYTLTSAISPAVVVAKGRGTVTISGAAINGAGTSINKGDEGTLILGYGANNYTGATVLHQGVLEFSSIANGGEPSALGAGLEFAQNWIMDGGTYRYTGGNASTNRSARLTNPTTLEICNEKTLTLLGSIEGSGEEQNFILDGNGQLTVGSASFFGYTGTTTLAGGTMFLSTAEIAKAGIGASSQLVLAGGTLKTAGENSNYETYSFPIEVKENTYSYLLPHRNCYLKNRLTGAGTIEIGIPYLREYFACNVEQFTGRIVANGLNSKDGSLFLANSQFNMPNTRVYLKGAGKTYMCAWTTNATNYVGGISGDVGTYLIGSSKNSKGYNCHWIVGGANSDETFNGIITNLPAGLNKAYIGTVSITKVGTGLWRLNGSNDYSGATALNVGTLIVNGRYSGGGTITVAADATLKGRGSVASGKIIVGEGGTIASGDTLVANHAFNLTGAQLELKSGATMQIPVSYYGASVRTNQFALGSLTIAEGATLALDLSEVEGNLPENSTLTVFSAVGEIQGSFSSIVPAVPAKGMKWDLSLLYTEGRISVRDDSFNAEEVTYSEASWFDEDKIDAEGYYWFNEVNAATTDLLIASGEIAFDAGGKTSSAPDYTNASSSHVGGLKMSGNTSEIVFSASGKFMSAKFDFFRAGTSALEGVIYASADGEEYIKIGDIAGNPREETFLDFSAALTGQNYRYIKITNSTTAVMYLQGAAITFQKMATGIESLSADGISIADCIDLSGRVVSPSKGQLLIKEGKKIMIY